MPLSHRALAGLVAAVWGVNFVAIHASLEQFPPLFLAGFRFLLMAVPTMLLVPRPQVPLRWLLGYGIGFGTLQFAFLYLGMAQGMPAGLASLVLQSSAPFTVLIGVALGQRVSRRQAAGLALALVGLGVVGVARSHSAAVLPFLLVLAGGFGWALGNHANARAQAPNALHLTLWMTVVPPLPLIGLALIVEGPADIARSFTTWDDATAWALVGLLYTILIGTVLGSGIWTWLMARHSPGLVAPFSLLVPVAGMTSAWLVLGESVRPAELAGAVLVVAGVLLGSRPRTLAQQVALPRVGGEDGGSLELESGLAEPAGLGEQLPADAGQQVVAGEHAGGHEGVDDGQPRRGAACPT